MTDQHSDDLTLTDIPFRAIVRIAADAIICVEADGRIIFFNDGAERMFCVSAEETLGQSIERFIPQRFRHVHARHMRGFLEGDIGARLMGERSPIHGVRANGEEFPAEAAISRVERGGRVILTVIMRDITEKRDAEARLEARVAARTRELEAEIARREQAQAQLVRSQRMEAFGQLTGGVAHDFNNLLTVISGNLELLEETALDERQKRLARRALEAAKMGAGLTNRLLTFARRGRLEPVSLNLNDEARGIIELLRRTLNESIVITTSFADDLWLIRADPSEVESAIINLAINSRDAMPNGGALSIETSNVVVDDLMVSDRRYEELSPGAYVRVSVSDNGAGMAPEVLQRAFEPFFTTKGPGRGTGLGLATIYGFAKQSKGHVTIYSEVGRGTTVSLYLPRDDAADMTPIAREAPEPAASPVSRSILVVEDNPGVREVAVERLMRLGYTVTAVENAASAIAVLESEAAIDLVFSDIVMAGGMTGHELAMWVRVHRPDVPVLLTSGFAEHIANLNGHSSDDASILRKPYSTAELGRAIRDALTQKHSG